MTSLLLVLIRTLITWDIELGVTPFTPTGTPTQTGVTNPYTYGSLLPNTTYDWYVRSDCGSGSYSDWAGPGSFTTDDGKATNPDPADGATNVAATYTTLDWDDVAGADSYTIDIGTTTGGHELVDDGACPSSQYTYGSNWTYAQHIYWTVTTVYTAKATVVGDEWDFTVEHDPSKLWESFEGTTFPPDGWTQKNLGDNTSGVTWARTTSYHHTGSASAYCNFGSSGEAQDEWLITPRLVVSAGDTLFSFWYKTYSSFGATVKVRLSTTNTDTASFTHTLMTLGAQSAWDKKEANLTSYIGNNVYIAFQYLGTYDWYAAIDDVEGPTLFVGPPRAPSNPSPADSATGVSNTADLSWTNGYQTENIDLYFSTDSSKVYNKDATVRVITGQNVETYDPGTTAYSTKYFWKVICKNSAKAETDGPLWKFTTEQDPNYGSGTGTPLYYFANSLATGAPSHPSYSWIDISTTGTDVIGTVDGDSKVGGPYSIGFDFNFFGTNYNQFWIAADGYICFSSITSSEMTNRHIPNTLGVGNIVALFWDDMNPGDTSVLDRHIYYGTYGGNMVITYLHLPEYNYSPDADGWITAQIILKPSGNVKLQYKEHGTSIDLNGATVGIENFAEDAGVEYHYNTDGGPIFSSPLAVEFGTDPNTLPVELISGSLTAEYAVNEYGSEYVVISWATASETDVQGFNIWRSEENDFSTAIQVNPEELISGTNTSTEHTYTYHDETIGYEELHAGDIYYYWLEVVDLGGTSSYSDAFEFVVPDNYEPPVPPELPLKIGLYQNCPNPFNPTFGKTKICFYLEEGTNANVEIKVYNIKGELVKTIWNRYTEFEKHPVPAVWDGCDENGRQQASGLYFYRMQVDGKDKEIKKLLLIK
ncbi:MAG: choice-of-anchor J domain-containing protein [Candidatus Cloacimonadota bacterium]|nr:choice-of-anchor J domain-containing protein [Candidatus Cloacimonadota bacterium]